MAKVKTSAQFKYYNPSANLLLPPNMDEWVPAKHLVRAVSDMVDRWDLTVLMNQYKGGGTTSYHPCMLLKVLLFAYCSKVFTGRKIASALRSDIHFMWLAGMNRPDFRTINNFRSGRAKETIDSLFTEMIKCLLEDQYITFENYFCDGTTVEADANRHKMVWKKNAEKYKQLAEQKCLALTEEIDRLNEEENKVYGNKDLAETGEEAEDTPAEIKEERTKRFNKLIKETTDRAVKKKAEKIKKELDIHQAKVAKYERQIATAGKRSGYNKTDEDASAMRMKNQEVLPGYNVMAGSENQLIIGCSVHQNTNDAACFKDHMEQVEKVSPVLPENIVTDAIFGTEENYEVLKEKKINNYLKYPTIYAEEKKSYKPEPFSAHTFDYEASTDSYICPNNKRLKFTGQTSEDIRKSGYVATTKNYACEGCQGCPFYKDCCEARNQVNREIQINQNLDVHRKKAAENLRTPKGWELRKRRGIEIESCYGDIKHNMGIRRCHLRGLDKVKTDFCLIAMAHNLRKIYLMTKKAA